jgi:hypothetical protein
MSHFGGKEALEHVIQARKKGALAAQEIHGTELPGPLFAALDACKESALLFLLVPLWPVALAWALWKTGRSALLGWTRLERFHRLIEEERYEIEHHRPQEREELRALYQAKGFKGKLLDEAVETLMADDNRLLQVMLTQELGLPLESMEHPLKQALGAFLGVTIAATVLFQPLTAFALIGLSALLGAHRARNRLIPALIWNLSLALLAYYASLYLR